MRRQFRHIASWRRLTKILAALVLTTCCASLTACGSSKTTLTADCAGKTPTLSATGTVDAGKCPTDTAITIDRTSFGEGGKIAEQIAAQAVAAGSATFTNGGLMSVVLYGRDADRAVTIFRGSLPTATQESDQLGRSEQAQQVASAIRSALVMAFSAPSHQTTKMKQATALLAGEGSDVARSLREAIRAAASGGGGNATAVVDLTDGLNATADFPLPQLIMRKSTDEIAQHLAKVAGMGSNPAVGLIAIPTIGEVPPQYQSSQNPELTDRLVSAWQKACELLQRNRCAISTST
jgi:hypothetical protein